MDILQKVHVWVGGGFGETGAGMGGVWAAFPLALSLASRRSEEAHSGHPQSLHPSGVRFILRSDQNADTEFARAAKAGLV